MNPIVERILAIKQYLRGLVNNEAVLQDADWLSFLVSLPPIPVFQQIAQLANKIVHDHELRVKFDALKHKAEEINQRLAQTESEVERITAIANTINSVTTLEQLVQELIEEAVLKVQQEDREFIVDTQNWSVQEIIGQIIEVDRAVISAQGHSSNELRKTRINAKKTYLSAHDHSRNVIDGTGFTDGASTVQIEGMSQTGHIAVTGNSIDLYTNSSLDFGIPDDTMSALCPNCGYKIEARRKDLIAFEFVQCPQCKANWRIMLQK